MPTTAILILLVGMTLLAFVDVHRQEVEDWATAVLGLAVIWGLHFDGISVNQWVWGAVSAAAVFLAYLELGTLGRMGGGDVKLSPVPALVLGAINPLLAVWSVALAFSIQSGFQVVNRFVVKAESPAMPHVPAIFAASVGSVLFANQMFVM